MFEKYQRAILGPSSPDSVAVFEKDLERHFTDFFFKASQKSRFLVKLR